MCSMGPERKGKAVDVVDVILLILFGHMEPMMPHTASVSSCRFGGIWDAHLHKPTHFLIMQIKALYGGFSRSCSNHPRHADGPVSKPRPLSFVFRESVSRLSVEKNYLFHVSVGGATRLWESTEEAWCSLKEVSLTACSRDVLTNINISISFAVETRLFVLFVHYLLLLHL